MAMRSNRVSINVHLGREMRGALGAWRYVSCRRIHSRDFLERRGKKAAAAGKGP